MGTELENLLETLDLEKLEENLFRGNSPQVGWQRVFGGQVIGQALVAANRTVGEGRTAHSLHGYFIRPGDPSIPIVYDVDRYRDGKSFTTRRVGAIQHGQPIFSMAASYHLAEEGFDHQLDMPDVPMPQDLPSEKDLLAKFEKFMPENMKSYFTRKRPIELRPTDPERYLNPKPDASTVQNVWIKASQPLPDDPALHQCVLAYASDMTLLDTSLVPHGRNLFDPELMMASLDHALWFHRPFKADQWLLYAQDSPSSSGALGFNRGSIFTQKGTLVASATQ
ncbi:MAG TPA: acyl-CoA thioesterase II, partial [Rhizobiales bacterium]|nr:acyl-CoA thioesterase II [Hyphomicrobiales bacterium]